MMTNNTTSFVLTDEELSAVLQILSFSQEVFEQMAKNAETDGNEQLRLNCAARAKISTLLYNKFITIANIGEPTSQEIH